MDSLGARTSSPSSRSVTCWPAWVTILWWACGYSIAFSHGTPFFGKLDFAFLKGVTSAPNTDYSYWVSHNVFCMYQLMFAIITPALIIGAIAERMKFSVLIPFMTLWMFVVYFPLAHMVWGADGFMNGVWNAGAGVRAMDFAGGTVVHMSSGWSALILCLLVGKRRGFWRENMAPHSMVLCAIGTGMFWSAGTASTPVRPWRPTGSPPTHLPQPRWPPQSHRSSGR